MVSWLKNRKYKTKDCTNILNVCVCHQRHLLEIIELINSCVIYDKIIIDIVTLLYRKVFSIWTFKLLWFSKVFFLVSSVFHNIVLLVYLLLRFIDQIMRFLFIRCSPVRDFRLHWSFRNLIPSFFLIENPGLKSIYRKWSVDFLGNSGIPHACLPDYCSWV